MPSFFSSLFANTDKQDGGDARPVRLDDRLPAVEAPGGGWILTGTVVARTQTGDGRQKMYIAPDDTFLSQVRRCVSVLVALPGCSCCCSCY